MKKLPLVLAALFFLAISSAVHGQFVYQTNADNTVTISNYVGGAGSVVIPATNSDGLIISGIGAHAFNAADVTSITIPNTVSNIENAAFSRTPLTSVLLPASVTNIGVEPFLLCTNLTNIAVDPSNTFYGSTNGVLFSATGSLVQYPGGLEGGYLVPDGVLAVDNLAFASCSGLTSISLPATLISIGNSAFSQCTNLASACFQGDYSTNFNSQAFFDDLLLTNVLYVSTATGWGTTYNNSPLGGGLPAFPTLICGSNALYGDLQVTISPPAALSAGGAWQITNGAFLTSGALATNLVAGNYTVSYKTIPGWLTPANQTVNVVDGATASAVGAYTAVLSGYLEVSLSPAGAVSNGAMWEVDAGSVTETNGAVVSELVGTHTVSFTAVSNYITPPDLSVTVTNRQTNMVSAVYESNGPTGSLKVVLLPQSLASQVFWQVVGDTSHYASGQIVTNLSPGNHTVSFATISNYLTPASQTVAIASNTVTAALGIYTAAVPGSLTVNILPGAAASAGAQWQVNGSNYSSGATVSLASGGYTVSFASIQGYSTPPAQSVTVSSGIAATASGIYTRTNAAVIFVTNGFGSISHGPITALNKAYKATAVPKARNIFIDWVGGVNQPYVVLGTNVTLAFTNVANLVLEANFMTNVFMAAQGTYLGLFAPANAPREQTNSGAFSFKVGGTGAFSGSLNVGGQTVPISGKLGPGGAASATTRAAKKVSALAVALQFDFASGTVSGTVTNSGFNAVLSGERSVFGASDQTPLAGQYTIVMPGVADPATGPFGDSYGTVKLSSSGVITLAGSLADGTALAQSSTLSQTGFWPLYVNLYGGKGSLWGWNYFYSNSIVSYPSLSWINAGNSSAAAADRSGFTNQQAALAGELYSPGNSLPAGLPVTLQQNGLSAIVISNLADNSNKLTLRTNKANGLITGTFANPANPKQTIKVNGVVLQGTTNAGGYFLVTNQSGAFSIGAP